MRFSKRARAALRRAARGRAMEQQQDSGQQGETVATVEIKLLKNPDGSLGIFVGYDQDMPFRALTMLADAERAITGFHGNQELKDQAARIEVPGGSLARRLLEPKIGRS